jgi:hypothetical protein
MVTQERLKELLHYDPETGVFVWTARRSGVRVDSIAGCVYSPSGTNEYRAIKVEGSQYQAHRLAWLYIYGNFPEDQIDHIDGDGLNNRISNLRDVTHQENGRNQKKPSTNTSGIIGVSWNAQENKWVAHIKINRKYKRLGGFLNKNDAKAARKKAEIYYGFHENHGR